MSQVLESSDRARLMPGGAGNAKAPIEIVTHSPEETISFGRELAKTLQPPQLVFLEGELGSGKTTLIKGIVAGLGAAREEDVTSPAFTLVHEYGTEGKVYHVDLYRIEDRRELETLGLEELAGQPVTVLVEWGEKLEGIAPRPCLKVRMEHVGREDRQIIVERLDS
jgi:tRNA threonylcarbamoyladenosine biosynthesis protein TsaE